MKYYAAFLLSSVVLDAQQISTSIYDINGHPVPGASISVAGNSKRETVHSVNGRSVPVQSVEDKVLSDSAGVKIVERTVRKYDANGNPSPPEKIRIEERKNSDGSGTVATTTMRADLNGNYSLAERTLSESRKAGDTLSTETRVERPTLNGAIQLVERREESLRALPGGAASQSVSVYKRDSNGNFGETAKETMERTVSGGKTIENSVVYEATNGRLDLVRQTVANIDKTATGEVREVNVFVADAPGRVAGSADRKPQLQQQQIIEKSAVAGGTTETLKVRRATDAGLSAPQKVSETVCRGDCK